MVKGDEVDMVKCGKKWWELFGSIEMCDGWDGRVGKGREMMEFVDWDRGKVWGRKRWVGVVGGRVEERNVEEGLVEFVVVVGVVDIVMMG